MINPHSSFHISQFDNSAGFSVTLVQFLPGKNPESRREHVHDLDRNRTQPSETAASVFRVVALSCGCFVCSTLLFSLMCNV